MASQTIIAEEYRHGAPPKAPAMRDMPMRDRPRERLKEQGAEALTNAELMAILIRTGLEGENALAMATRILAKYDGISGMARIGYPELIAERGLSHAKACQIMAGVELGKRVASVRNDDQAAVETPEDIANLVMAEMNGLEREHLRIILLNTKNRVVLIHNLYVGSVNAALVRPAEVFAEAVRWTCPAIAIVHNHPSGDPHPSDEDVKMTERLIQAGNILDIEVVDHVIIGRQTFVSMREKGFAFK
jgi:DNA repair protein RadC